MKCMLLDRQGFLAKTLRFMFDKKTMVTYHKRLGILCNGKFTPTEIYPRTNPILNTFITHDKEMGHLKLPKVISNTLEDLSLKVEVILCPKVFVLSLTPCPPVFICSLCNFSLSSSLPLLLPPLNIILGWWGVCPHRANFQPLKEIYMYF